jgi:hypothetical protein
MSDVPPSAEEAARNRAGRALRRLGHSFVGHHAPPELIDEVADVLDRFSAHFDTGAPRHRDADSFDRRDRPEIADGEFMNTYDDRPFSGRSSPWGLDLEVHRRGDEIEARVTLESAHEGAPARSHGGIVAGLFDDVFGFVLDILQTAAFTGMLTIRYEAPTPLHRPLVCRGRLHRRDGRKIWIDGELVDPHGGPDGTELVAARAEGLFIAVDVEVMRSALTARLPAPPDEA